MKKKITDTLKSLLTAIFIHQKKQIIKNHKPQVVAVVGSVGKTGTKMAIATLLSQSLRVQVQEGNYNTPIAVPFIFLGRALPSLYNPFGWIAAWIAGQRMVWGEYPYDVVVVELGSDKPGDILEFEASLRPNISVVTAVSDEHMEFFKTLDEVAREELSIARFSALTILNSDDIDKRFIDKYIPSDAATITYGFANADYTASLDGDIRSRNLVITNSTSQFEVNSGVKLFAKHSIKGVIAASAVANIVGISNEDITRGITAIMPTAGRMQLLKGINDSTIIDDSYNSSPLAVSAALESLYEIKAPQKIALLGNMNELGETSQDSHEKIGKLCNPKQLDLVVTLGPESNKYLAPSAKANGCNVVSVNSPYQAAEIIKQHLKRSAVVLVKGSQNGVFAEEAIKALLANPSDESKLVRQSKMWLAKKEKQFLSYQSLSQ